MPIKNLIADAKQRMDASVETVRRELATMRTGRASLSMLDGIRVDYYGTPTPLNQVGSLAVPDPTMITIQPRAEQDREQEARQRQREDEDDEELDHPTTTPSGRSTRRPRGSDGCG